MTDRIYKIIDTTRRSQRMWLVFSIHGGNVGPATSSTIGGKLKIAQRMVGHSNAQTTGFYDRRNDDINVSEVLTRGELVMVNHFF